MRKFIFLLTALFALSCGICSAEVRTFHAENSYLMDKGEPIKEAQDYIFKDDIRNAMLKNPPKVMKKS